MWSSLTKAVHGTAWNTSSLECCAAAWGEGQITNTAWKNSSGTMLLQLQQLHWCDWKDKWLPKHARLSLDGGWRRAWEVRYWPWNVKSTIGKAELSLHSRPGLLWAYLSSKLIGVVVQSPFKKLLKSQLYLLGLCSNLAAVFCKGCRVQRRKSSRNKFHGPFAPKQRWLPTTAQLQLFPLHLSNEIPKLWWTRPQIQWT